MRVLHLTNLYPSPRRPWFGTFIEEEVRALGPEVESEVVFVDGAAGKIEYARGIARVRDLRGRFDLIHAHHGWCGLAALAARSGVPIVLTLLGGDVFEREVRYKRLLARLVRAALPRFAALIVRSPAMAAALPPAIHPSVHSVPHGVDVDLFAPSDRRAARAALGLDPERPQFLFACADNDQSRREKRRDVAEAAVAALGEGRGALLEAARTPHHLMPLYVNAATAVLLPSDYEGSPNIVKEALACERPVVAADVGDVRGLIEGLPGCRLAERSGAAFAEALRPLLADDLRAEGGRARLAERGLTLAETGRRFRAVYEGVLADGQAAAVRH